MMMIHLGCIILSSGRWGCIFGLVVEAAAEPDTRGWPCWKLANVWLLLLLLLLSLGLLHPAGLLTVGHVQKKNRHGPWVLIWISFSSRAHFRTSFKGTSAFALLFLRIRMLLASSRTTPRGGCSGVAHTAGGPHLAKLLTASVRPPNLSGRAAAGRATHFTTTQRLYTC